MLSTKPDAVGICTLLPSSFELGLMCWGHHLAGDWGILRWGMEWGRRRGADCFVYPISVLQPNAAQLGRILTRRYGFAPYQHLFLKRFNGHV